MHHTTQGHTGTRRVSQEVGVGEESNVVLGKEWRREVDRLGRPKVRQSEQFQLAPG